jgi:Universal stress protein family
MQGHQDIVVGYDGSPLSEFALRRALKETRAASFALIHVVTVVDEVDGNYRLPTGAEVPRYSGLDALRLIAGTLVESWALESPYQRVISHVRTGNPALALVDLAYRFHAERIILGRTGSGKSNDGIGSVAKAVLAGSHEIPVDIVAPSLSMYPESTRRPKAWADVFENGRPSRTPLRSVQLS